MKKVIFVFILLLAVLLPVSAQGFYGDIGLGVVAKNTETDYILEVAPFGGLRVGYGPFNTIPIYVVGDLFLINNPFFGGLGVIFYPMPFIQLGLSLDYSFYIYPIYNQDGFYDRDEIANGFGWNLSTALDLGKKNHGLLIGLQYIGSINEFEFNDNFVLSSFGIFVKYTFRQRGPQQTTATNPVQRQSSSNIGIDGAVGRASRELINNLPENTRLAVISISSNDGNLSTRVVDELEFQLVASRKFTIVNRSALDTIRREQNFQMSGDVSDESAVSIGQMLGANIVIIGSITEAGRNQRLVLRALDVRTSEIITMVREDF